MRIAVRGHLENNLSVLVRPLVSIVEYIDFLRWVQCHLVTQCGVVITHVEHPKRQFSDPSDLRYKITPDEWDSKTHSQHRPNGHQRITRQLSAPSIARLKWLHYLNSPRLDSRSSRGTRPL